MYGVAAGACIGCCCCGGRGCRTMHRLANDANPTGRALFRWAAASPVQPCLQRRAGAGVLRERIVAAGAGAGAGELRGGCVGADTTAGSAIGVRAVTVTFTPGMGNRFLHSTHRAFFPASESSRLYDFPQCGHVAEIAMTPISPLAA